MVSSERDSNVAWEPVHPRLHLGTSSFSESSWVGSFYPAGTKPADFLAVYSRRFDTVEIDATFYRIPSPAQARSWAAKTPQGFRIAAKVPQIITHEKLLVHCEEEMKAFLGAMDEMGDRLGPLLFQFPYFRRDAFASAGAFLNRLRPFLDTLPSGRAFALEVRNKAWVGEPLLSLLRERGIAFALIDHPWMSPVETLTREHDVVTADFSYVRWLGDRKGIEVRTDRWDKLIVDRSAEMDRWVTALAALLERGIEILGYFNNHYAGHAPGSIELLRETWRRRMG
jgi:uncharacterized protein YecE (DUF72 family)